ncbi:MAG: LPS assembly lipoprotein LptE [Bacteroidales bacterium]|nr:LPS assembly lipoprotein LptE [Bacteroidales bacterium]
MKYLCIIILLIIVGCKVNYTFSGASYSADIHTFHVSFFQNQAPLVNPSLSNVFTEALKDRINNQTKLKLVTRDGDLQYEGEIINYSIAPQTISGNEVAALNRLTISVRVKFTNTKNPNQNFDKTFSQFADYESSKPLQSIEDELIKEIVDKLTQDIFNASLVNW